MALTIADAGVALVALISAYLAYQRGLVRETLAIAGWIAAGFVGFYFGPMVSPLLLEVPYLGDFLHSSCTLTSLAAFVAVFGVALIVISIFTPVISSAVQATPLAVVDRGLGFIFGVARGLLLVAVLYLLYDLVVTDQERLAVIENSASRSLIADAAAAVKEMTPTTMPDWLQSRIDHLTAACAGEPT